MNVKKGDNVIVLVGKDKGKSGKILTAFPSKNLVIVEGVNIIKKHQKSRRNDQKGQIIEKAMPIDASNVKLNKGAKSGGKVKG